MKRKDLAQLAGIGIAGAAAFTGVIRPWYLHWGATKEEVDRAMPLDDLVPNPSLKSTMAVTVHAPAGAIWPWIAQIGAPPRAGFYSYTFVERMVGLKIENRDEILPEFQHLEKGDLIDHEGTMSVLAVEPNTYLVLGPPPGTPDVRAAWSIALYPIDENTTRLITRVRGQWSYLGMFRSTPFYTWPMWLLLEPGAFIMERKMLLEIKRLAERTQLRMSAPKLHEYHANHHSVASAA